MLRVPTRAFSSSLSRLAFAKMQLLGTIGNISLKTTKDDVPFITYSLAVNRYSPQTASDGKNTVTDWYNLSVFEDKQVEFFTNYLKPGSQIYVEADVSQRVVVDESGENKLVFTSLKQTKFDVVRFAKKTEAEEES